MKFLKTLFALGIAFGALATQEARAVDGVNVINFTLKALAEGDVNQSGNNVVSKVDAIRINTRDFMNLLEVETGFEFGSRAQLLLIRRNFGEGTESVEIAIREPGFADFDVSQYFLFEPGSFVQAGTINVVTGKARNTLYYIGTLAMDFPDLVFLSLTGFTTEKTGTARLGGSEVDGSVFSLVSNMAGEGSILGDLMIVQGTVRVGPTKFVASSVQ